MMKILRMFCVILFLGPINAFALEGPPDQGREEEKPPPTEEITGKSLPLPLTWQEAYRKSRKEKNFSKGPNVHYSKAHCGECHGKGEPSQKNLLFEGQDIAMCRSCHPKSLYHVHAVGIPPKNVKVPEEFPLSGGKVTCVTCHDEPSCNPIGSQSWKRPFFLRGTKSGFAFCFSCHTAKGYKAYNPHESKHLEEQMARKNNCLFCHIKDLPVDQPRKGLDSAALKGKPNDLCIVCHLEEPHFGVSAHLEGTNEKLRSKLKEAVGQAGPNLPIGENDTMLCVSCHEPHMPGLMTGEPQPVGEDVWLKGESSEFRDTFVQEHLRPLMKERIAEMESAHAKKMIIRAPEEGKDEGTKLLRKGLQKNGSICLYCHDVFEDEGAGKGKESMGDYRMLR